MIGCCLADFHSDVDLLPLNEAAAVHHQQLMMMIFQKTSLTLGDQSGV